MAAWMDKDTEKLSWQPFRDWIEERDLNFPYRCWKAHHLRIMTGKFCDLQASSVHKENATASSFHSFAQWISTACLFCSRNWECKNKQEKCSEIQTNMMNYCGKVINRGMQQVRSTGWGSLKETMWMTSQRKVSRLGPEPRLSRGQRWGGRAFWPEESTSQNQREVWCGQNLSKMESGKTDWRGEHVNLGNEKLILWVKKNVT